ncbi:uncharacterized protein LOC144097238 [Amblyomma americanum]
MRPSSRAGANAWMLLVFGVFAVCAGQRKGRTTVTTRPIGTAPANAEIPVTEFRCSNQDYPGYFADVETDCQVYHNCLADGRNSSFLCVNGTIFNQRNFVCDWWYKFDCRKAPSFYHLNLLRNKEKNGSKTTEGAAPVAPPVRPPPPPPPPPPFPRPQATSGSKRSREKEARSKPSSPLTSRQSKPSSKPTKTSTFKILPKAPPKTHEPIILLPLLAGDGSSSDRGSKQTTRERSSSSRGRAQMRVFAKIKEGQPEEPRVRPSKSQQQTKPARTNEDNAERGRQVQPAFNGDATRHQDAGGFQEWTSIGPVSGRPSVTRVQFHTFSANPPRFEPPLPLPEPEPEPAIDPASWLEDDFNRQAEAGRDNFRGEVEDARSREDEAYESGPVAPEPRATEKPAKQTDEVVRLAKALPPPKRQTVHGGWRGKKEAYPGLQDKKRLFYRFQPSEPFAGYRALSFFGRTRGPMNDLTKLPRLVSVNLNKVTRKEPEYAIKPLLLSVKLDQSSELDSRPARGAPPGLCFCPCH